VATIWYPSEDGQQIGLGYYKVFITANIVTVNKDALYIEAYSGVQNRLSYGARVDVEVNNNGVVSSGSGVVPEPASEAWRYVSDSGVAASWVARTGQDYTLTIPSTVSVYNDEGTLLGTMSGSISVDIPALDIPAMPQLSVSRVSDTRHDLTINADTTWSVNTKLQVAVSVNGGAYSVVYDDAFRSTYSYTTTAGNRYQYYVKAGNDAGFSSAVYSQIIYNTPNAPVIGTNTRESDTRNTLTWTNSNPSGNPYYSIQIWRSVNGSVMQLLQTLDGAATSFVDTSTQANSFYFYLVGCISGSLSASSDTSNVTYNTPATPSGLVASRTASNTVVVNFTNPARTDTAINIQRSTDGSSWSTLAPITGSGLTSFSDNPGGGTYYYRCRTVRGSLVSDWSERSNAVVTLTPPAAPTLTSPGNGATISQSQALITYRWQHNSIDGSSQTSAELGYSTDGGATWIVNTTTTGQSMSLTNGFSANQTVIWRVRTKGAADGWSAWSSIRSFTVKQQPQVTITSPGEIITNVPFNVTWDYSDSSGTQIRAVVSIQRTGGGLWILYNEAIDGDATSITIDTSEFMPTNGADYRLVVEVTSSSSLSASTSIAVHVDYIEPAMPIGSATVNAQDMSVTLSVAAGDDAGLPPTTSVGIFRVATDGSLVSLTGQVPSGTSYVDMFPPTDVDVVYRFVAYTANGLTSSTDVTVSLDSHMCAIITIAGRNVKVALDTRWNATREHKKTIFETAGDNPAPLVFYGRSQNMTGSVSGVATTNFTPALEGDLMAVEQFTGAGVLRLPRRDPIAADMTVTWSSRTKTTVDVTITWQRVRGDGLAL
jgi:hypothetical protein